MTDEIEPPKAESRPKNGRTVLWLLVGSLLVGAGATAILLTEVQGTQTPSATEKRSSLYQCPMHPTVVMDRPGACPICGMKLLPIAPQEDQSGPVDEHSTHTATAPAEQRVGAVGLTTVRIDLARHQMLGLTTVAARMGPIGGAWRTGGRVAVDETRIRHVNIKVPGFVERIHVDFLGKPVKKGEALFSIYSPELLAAQEELLLALRTQKRLEVAGTLSGDGDALVAAALRKLELWDIPKREIDQVIATGRPLKALTIYSPIAGAVTKKDVVQGMKLDAGAMPYEVTDLSEVWVLADVYESELRHLRLGMAADLVLKAFPNKRFEGKATFIDPILDLATRTVKVRLSFPNPSGDLRPGMFGEVLLLGAPREALRVPADALIHSGTESYLFVALGEGRFEPRAVSIGETDGTHVEVVTGLQDGELVVGRANFLVDSESRLRASLNALREAGRHDGHAR